MGAVVGPEFEPELLEEVLGRPVAEELEAARAAPIIELRGRPADRYLFSHAVFREALVERPAVPAVVRGTH